MDENKAAETRSFSEGWIPHALVGAATVIVLVALGVIQPWSGNTITIVNSYRMTSYSAVTNDTGRSEYIQEMTHVVPDRSYIATSANDQKQEILVIGEDIYTNDPQIPGSYFIEAISLSVYTLVPGQEHTQKVLDEFADREEMENEKIDGIDCQHYRGRMDYAKGLEEKIAGLDPEEPDYEDIVEALESQIEMMRQIETDIEVWVGKDDGIIRQIKYTIQIPVDERGHWQTSMTLVNYSDFNSSIVIEPPIDASGELLPGWYVVGGPAREASFFVVIDADITDLKYRQTGIHIIVYNTGDVAVDNVRIDMKKPEDCRDNNPECWISAIPAVIVIDNNVQMNPGDSMVFVAEYKYDETDSKVKELLEKAKVRITYIMDGRGNTRIYSAGSPYPEAVPP